MILPGKKIKRKKKLHYKKQKLMQHFLGNFDTFNLHYYKHFFFSTGKEMKFSDADSQ